MFLLLKYQILKIFLIKIPKKKILYFSPWFDMESPISLRRRLLGGYQEHHRLSLQRSSFTRDDDVFDLVKNTTACGTLLCMVLLYKGDAHVVKEEDRHIRISWTEIRQTNAHP